jgi:hypothetical protein
MVNAWIMRIITSNNCLYDVFNNVYDAREFSFEQIDIKYSKTHLKKGLTFHLIIGHM